MKSLRIKKSFCVKKPEIAIKKVKKTVSSGSKHEIVKFVKKSVADDQNQIFNEDVRSANRRKSSRCANKPVNNLTEKISKGMEKSVAVSPKQVLNDDSQKSELAFNKHSVCNTEKKVFTEHIRKSSAASRKQKSDDEESSGMHCKTPVYTNENSEKLMTLRSRKSLTTTENNKPLLNPKKQSSVQRTTGRSLFDSKQQISDRNAHNSISPVKQKSSQKLLATKKRLLPHRARKSSVFQPQQLSKEISQNSILIPAEQKSAVNIEKQVSPRQTRKSFRLSEQHSILPAKQKSAVGIEKQASPQQTRKSLRISGQYTSNGITLSSSALSVKHTSDCDKPLPSSDEHVFCPAPRSSKSLPCSEKSLKQKSSVTNEKQVSPQQTRKSMRISKYQTSNGITSSASALSVKNSSPDCDKPLPSSNEHMFDLTSKRSSTISLQQTSNKYSQDSLACFKTQVCTRHTRKSSAIAQEQVTQKSAENSENQKSLANTKKQVSVQQNRKTSITPEQQITNEMNSNSFVTPIKRKYTKSTSNAKQLSTKMARKSQKRVSNKSSPMKIDVLSFRTPTVERSGYIRTSLVTFQEKSPEVKRIPCSVKCTVKYKKYLETIPVDSLSLRENSLQKQKKSDSKLPGKNTLKRKRFTFAAMKDVDEDYEDDIYETKKFEKFKDLIPSATPPTLKVLSSVATPHLGFNVTPTFHKKSPKFKDCFSPRELALQRKVAEECFYKRKQRRKYPQSDVQRNSKTPTIPEKKKLHFNQVLLEATKIQEKIAASRKGESEEEDSYFSDE